MKKSDDLSSFFTILA